MNTEYKRDLNHNYLILSGRQQEGEGYQSKMLEHNTVHGILPCSVHYVEDMVKYYYDISSRQPIASAFSIRKMTYQIVSSIFMQMEQIFHELDKYLLDSSRILLDVRFMYWDVEEEKLSLIFYPQKEEQEDSVQKFAEELLNLVDYADKKAVDAVYWFYQKVQAENVTLSEAFVYFKEQNADGGIDVGRGADCAVRRYHEEDEVQEYSAERGKKGETQRAGVERRESLCVGESYGNHYEDGYEDYDAEDDTEDDTENEPAGRLRIFKRLLSLLLCLAVYVAAGYIYTHYALTVNEVLAGCGFLAMIPAAFLLHLIRKWQKRVAEQRSKNAVESQRSKNARMPEKINTANRAEKKGELPCEKENLLRKEDLEADSVYGETTYFGAEGWQQERCLEGRYKGKQIMIAIHETPFIIGKLQGAVSFVLSDSSVSRMHAQFVEKEGKLFLQDMNSKNGTYKNGVAISAEEEAEVYSGDEIRFGRLRFTYH